MVDIGRTTAHCFFTDDIARLTLGLYLLASALARFDVRRLIWWEIPLRLAVALSLMMHGTLFNLAGVALFVVLVGRQYMMGELKRAEAA